MISGRNETPKGVWHMPKNTMTATTLPLPDIGLIIWPGSEPVKTTAKYAVDTLRACSFMGEPVEIVAHGKKTGYRDIPRVWGVTDAQAVIVQEQLLHRLVAKLEAFFPEKTPMTLIGPDKSVWDDGWIMEVGDGWTIGATIELGTRYRGSIKWHVYDPEGDPLIENADERSAIVALVTHIVAYTINRNLES